MQIYSCPHFDLKINKTDLRADMVMRFKTGIYNTARIPATLELIQREIPGVLKTKCFNDAELPFAEEVKQTELGHLFEHILLQYLLETQLNKGRKNVCFRGETSWDWRIEEKGLFHIYVTCQDSHCSEFNEAMEKTIRVMRKILASSCEVCRNQSLLENNPVETTA